LEEGVFLERMDDLREEELWLCRLWLEEDRAEALMDLTLPGCRELCRLAES